MGAGVKVIVGVSDGVGVRVLRGVREGVDVIVGVAVSVRVCVTVGVRVRVGVEVWVGVLVRVGVAVGEGVVVRVGVAVAKRAIWLNGVLSWVNPTAPNTAASTANKKGLRSARRCLPRIRPSDTATDFSTKWRAPKLCRSDPEGSSLHLKGYG